MWQKALTNTTANVTLPGKTESFPQIQNETRMRLSPGSWATRNRRHPSWKGAGRTPAFAGDTQKTLSAEKRTHPAPRQEGDRHARSRPRKARQRTIPLRRVGEDRALRTRPLSGWRDSGRDSGGTGLRRAPRRHEAALNRAEDAPCGSSEGPRWHRRASPTPPAVTVGTAGGMLAPEPHLCHAEAAGLWGSHPRGAGASGLSEKGGSRGQNRSPGQRDWEGLEGLLPGEG